MENILDEANLKEFLSVERDKIAVGEKSYSKSCYLKEGLVSNMPNITT